MNHHQEMPKRVPRNARRRSQARRERHGFAPGRAFLWVPALAVIVLLAGCDVPFSETADLGEARIPVADGYGEESVSGFREDVEEMNATFDLVALDYRLEAPDLDDPLSEITDSDTEVTITFFVSGKTEADSNADEPTGGDEYETLLVETLESEETKEDTVESDLLREILNGTQESFVFAVEIEVDGKPLDGLTKDDYADFSGELELAGTVGL